MTGAAGDTGFQPVQSDIRGKKSQSQNLPHWKAASTGYKPVSQGCILTIIFRRS